MVQWLGSPPQFTKPTTLFLQILHNKSGGIDFHHPENDHQIQSSTTGRVLTACRNATHPPPTWCYPSSPCRDRPWNWRRQSWESNVENPHPWDPVFSDFARLFSQTVEIHSIKLNLQVWLYNYQVQIRSHTISHTIHGTGIYLPTNFTIKDQPFHVCKYTVRPMDCMGLSGLNPFEQY